MRPLLLLFSFNGRVSRTVWWFVSLGTIILMYSISFLVAGNFENGVLVINWGSSSVIYPITVMVAGYINIVNSIKRYHDRGKSGWWLFIFLVPFIGSFWLLIELGFLKGTDGDNEYGSNPLAPQAVATA